LHRGNGYWFVAACGAKGRTAEWIGRSFETGAALAQRPLARHCFPNIACPTNDCQTFVSQTFVRQTLLAELCGELPIRVVKRGLTFPRIHILEVRFMKHEEEE